MDPVVDQILQFVRQTGTEIGSFMTTVNSKGALVTRQVSAFVEDGFVAGTMSPGSALKTQHIPRNPNVSYVWVELKPARPARAVTMIGLAEVIRDEAEIAAFIERREAFYGRPSRGGVPGQVLIRVQPQVVRAEGFVPDAMAAVIRDFANPTLQLVTRPGRN